jgi:hypothetical protein
VDVLQGGTQTEAQISALRLMLEFGSNQQKINAMKEIEKIAFAGGKKGKAVEDSSDVTVEGDIVAVEGAESSNEGEESDTSSSE